MGQSQSIWLVRHGETKYNKEGRFQGNLDIPLSDRGRIEAKKISDKVKGKKIDTIYSSKLKRAYHTASYIAEPHNITVEIINGVEELGFGLWEGKSFNELDNKEKELVSAWFSDPLNHAIPEGETFSKFQKRIDRAYRQLLKIINGKNVLLVTHGGVIKILLINIFNFPLSVISQLYVAPCSLTEIRYVNDFPFLALFNDTCHLD